MQRKDYYGVIGNGETCALVSPSGSIEWLCLPKFDSTILYAKALDPKRGGSLDVSLYERGKNLLFQNQEQVYVENTNVLRTILKYKNFTVNITDFMPYDEIYTKRRIFRIIDITNTSRSKRKIELKLYSGVQSPDEKYSDIKEGNIIERRGFSVGFTFFDKNINKIKIKPKYTETVAVGVVYEETKQKTERALKRIKYLNPEKELEMCIKFWRNWLDRGIDISFKNKDYENMYHRCLLVNKLLVYTKTGAILAAPTASFPATPTSTENWDYRFTWLRDSYFVSRGFLKAGHYREVEKSLEFFFKLQNAQGHWKFPFYKIDGKEPGDECIIEELKGANEEECIRINNAAKDQLQLDSEGSVLHTAYLYYIFSEDEDFLRKHWKKIMKAANWVTRNYSKKENGIWEFRDNLSHWTYGKVMCYVGLESAIKIAEIIGKTPPKTWERIKDKIKKEVIKKSWSKQRKSFLQAYEDDTPVDISVLAIEDYGILKPTDSKIKKTIKQIEEKLITESGGVKRYEEAVLPFYLPTLWLASHYIREGKKERAKKLIETAINGSTSLYLCAEHFDPVQGTQHGNFPQTFCASVFIEQLLNLKERKDNILKNLKIFENLNYIKRHFMFSSEDLTEEEQGISFRD